MALFYQEDFNASTTFLNPEESRHLAKVLRIKEGKEIDVTDGKGHLYRCEVTTTHQKKTELKVIGQQYLEKKNCYRHIAIAPTKNLDRIEWFVEKAIEFGIDEISFLLCHNSERRTLKTERLWRKAISAMKQSGQLHLPKINELQKFEELIQSNPAGEKFIAYVDFENPLLLKEALQSGSNLVMIGPEGDFSDNEVDAAVANGFIKVSLGDSRLRTETAGIATAHLLNLFCQ